MRNRCCLLLAALVAAATAGLVVTSEPLPGVPIAGPVKLAAPDQPGRAPAAPVARTVLPARQAGRPASPGSTDAWTTIKSEGFESAFPNDWTLYGTPTWDDETYRKRSGYRSGYCVGSTVNPPGPYPNNVFSWMVYGPFSLADASDAKLDFWRWLKVEDGYDYLFWGASIDGSQFYGYADDSTNASWQSESFDLKNVPTLGNLCGRSQVWVGFLFESDFSNTDEGAYLDDILLQKDTGGGGNGPDLTYAQPSGWDFPIVPSNVTGTHTVPQTLNPGTTYIDWAGKNAGDEPTADTFYIYLYLDNVPLQGWYAPPPIVAGQVYYVDDYATSIAAGSHTLATMQDSTRRIAEPDENNNRWSHSWTWGGGGPGGDYTHVTITSSALASAFAALGSYVEANMGLNDTLVTTEAIYSSFPGRDNQEKIRNFIKHAYQEWGTSHVVLGGDDEVIPGRDAYGRVNSQTEYIPCDLYYSDLDGTWDADNDNQFGEPEDNPDMYADVHVGRVTASNAAQAARFTSKLSNYHGNPGSAHLEEVLLTGFDLDYQTRGETTMDFYDSNYLPAVMRPPNKVYDSHSGSHKTNTITQLNSGQNVWVHADHGQWNELGIGSNNHGTSMTAGDMGALGNSGKYTTLISMACLVGAFDYSDCVTEAWMDAANGGGVAAMTNSRYGWYNPGYNPQRTLSALYSERVVEQLFNLPGHGCLQDFATAKATLVPAAQGDMAYRWCMYALNLFGEPRMMVWIPGQSGAAEPGQPGAPTGLRLVAAGPFGGSARVSFELPVAGRARLEVFDRAGRRVRTLVDAWLGAGRHEATWDGQDENHSPGAAGVYYLRLATDSGDATAKLVKVAEER